ncbi:G-protein complex alpha subunit GpaA/FadA [Catenaria anguillulae PL171]|uniref:Guanine nucleotide-binding protein alpha-16 subunit n=1 Tax=Catenaria anguillulae PL171 TaxID=765915 RepID=A0A1Y2I297_9FUNG|nr:G-protein complex alpha subunit GpaA/FadA [Catenaria anguillulae PL171]
MGCTPSKDDDGRRVNQQIDEQLRMDRQRATREVKCLLLGAGESGKSTILKQMQLIHGVGYTDADRYAFREVIFSNLVQSIKVIISAMPALGVPLADPSLETDVQYVLTLPHQLDSDPLPDKIVMAVARLWRDRGVLMAFTRSREYQLNDSAKYYLDALPRLAEPDYLPTDQDILRSRVKTTGIVECAFQIGDLTYRMFDVGGQRSERKKWIHCFENVTAIVFLVAISEYDQMLLEDESVNRMQESLTLFSSICNSRWFTKTSIILFLNKIDLFKDKVGISPIADFFPDFPGPNTFQDGCHFFLKKFTDLNQSEYKQVYAHFTCACDTTQVKFVMAAVNDIIIQESLRAAGLVLA